MKIALLAHNKFPIAQPYAGGLEMITHLLAEKLQQKGHEVDIYALSGSDAALNVIPLDDDSINWSSLSRKSESGEIHETFIDDLMYSLALSKISGRDYDVVHNHSMHHLPLIWAENTSLAVISSFHTPVFEDIHRGLTSIQNDHKQHFTTVSAKLGSIYEEFISTYSVVHNGIEIKDWEFYESSKDTHVCWIGRICKEKAPHKAIEMALKANKKIVLAGPASEEKYYREYFQPYLTHKDVEYVGHVKQDQINRIIGSASATLFTSVWEEPYGLVIAESLACGTPVVAWNVGAAPEILTSKCGRIVPAFDEELFVSAIKESIQLDRKACRYRAIQFCDAAVMVSAYERLYEEVRAEKHIPELKIS